MADKCGGTGKVDIYGDRGLVIAQTDCDGCDGCRDHKLERLDGGNWQTTKETA